ncbi:MAG: hypothetical protein ABI317_13630 [Gaiellales bacterium]
MAADPDAPLPPAHHRALETVCGRLEGLELEWAVSGSVALVLQGVETTCNDLDLLFTSWSVRIAESLLAREIDERVAPRRRVDIRGLLGRAQIEGISVELLGDVQNALPDGRWSDPPRIVDQRTWVPFGERDCPVVTLAALEASYALRGRADKVRLIREARSGT